MKRLLKFIALIVYIAMLLVCFYYTFRSTEYIEQLVDDTTKD